MESNSLSRRELIRVAGTGALVAGASLSGSKIVVAQAQTGNIAPPNAPPIGAEPVAPIAQPFPNLSDPLPNSPDGRIGFAVVGLGKFALNQIIPSIGDTRYCKLAALVSGDRAKAERVATAYGVPRSGIYSYDTFDLIAANPNVQVIYVITPNALHRRFVERAASAKKHVLCEKPLATNSSDARAMIAACNAAGVKLMTAYRAQYEPYNLEAIRIAQSGELGKMTSIVADHGRPVNPEDPADQWRLDLQMAGGGPLPDVGIYSLNACRYLTGQEPLEVSAMLDAGAGDPKFREVERSLVWTMRFPNNVLTTCTTSYAYQETKRFRVFFEKGWLELDPATDYYQHRMFVERPIEKKGEQPQAVVEYGSITEERPIAEKNQFALMMDHMAECVLQNKTPETPGEEGLRDVAIIERIYEAARTGRTLKV